MAGVAKTTDLSGAELSQMSDAIKAMSKESRLRPRSWPESQKQADSLGLQKRICCLYRNNGNAWDGDKCNL